MRHADLLLFVVLNCVNHPPKWSHNSWLHILTSIFVSTLPEALTLPKMFLSEYYFSKTFFYEFIHQIEIKHSWTMSNAEITSFAEWSAGSRLNNKISWCTHLDQHNWIPMKSSRRDAIDHDETEPSVLRNHPTKNIGSPVESLRATHLTCITCRIGT